MREQLLHNQCGQEIWTLSKQMLLAHWKLLHHSGHLSFELEMHLK